MYGIYMLKDQGDIMNKIKYITLSTLCSTLLFIGCGSDTTTNDNNEATSSSSKMGVLVDPYIVGATLCQDSNDNNSCDEGELTSTETSQSGEFTFSQELTSGKQIIIKAQGTHDGLPYDLNISAVVASDGTVDVVSPLTTFQSKGLSAEQLVEVLNKAASDAGVSSYYSFNDTTIFNNPLNNNLLDTTISNLNDAELTNIRASLASYGILKIMNGSDTLKSLSPTELYVSGTTTGGALNEIASNMLKSLANSLNVELLSTIKTAVDSGRQGLISGSGGMVSESKALQAMPDVTASLIIKVATKVISDISTKGYETCNATEGSDIEKVQAALIAAQSRAALITTPTNMIALGTILYAFEIKENINSILSGPYAVAISGIKSANANMKIGLEASSKTTTFHFNADGNIEAYIKE